MGLTILIIDDEPHLPYQLARFLRKHSYEVLVAPDGETGLRVLQNNIVDLILLDLRLPRVGGLEVLSSVRKGDIELPVVMITAYGDVQSAVAAMKQGAADYLLKGFDLDELLLVVKRALEKSAMARELRQLRRERNAHYHLDYIVGHSERMHEVFEFIFRLAVLNIKLPPLRERPDDIMLFAARFIEDFNQSLGRNIQRVSPEAQRLLRAYNWPGNIRELKNVIERAVILSSGEELLPDHLPREIVGPAERGAFCAFDLWERWLNARPLRPVSLDDLSDRVEQHVIRWALETSKHNRARAAELLGFTKVDQLRYLMRKHGIE